jgi:hypothetical protein
MIYESQGIQSQGGLFEITSQEPIITGEHRQGKRGSRRKARSKSQCDHCGGEFEVIRGTVGQFCSHVCMFEFRKKSVFSWANCYQCLALLGIGMTVASRLLKQNKATMIRVKRKMGFETQLPECGEWRRYAQREQSKDCGWWGNADTAELWMREIKARFPDWSSAWRKERFNLEMNRKYHSMTPEEKAARNRRVTALRKARAEANPEIKKRDREKIKQWKKANPDKNRESLRKCVKKRKQNDPGFRVKCNLRNRFKDLMNGAKKGGSSAFSSLIGCDTKQLAKHLESKFKKGMSWGNYGTEWHVDHVIPCAAFDHTDPKQAAQCWHWTNLQPLGAAENLAKSDSIQNPQMNLLLCATH